MISGKLNSYFADINKQALERLETFIEQMKQAQGVTEQLKAENAFEWIGRMNNIRACAVEIVNTESFTHKAKRQGEITAALSLGKRES